jgi:hypothetical protein
MNGGTGRIPLVVTALTVFLLVGVVAVASTGSTPSGEGGTRRPGDIVIDTVLSLSLVAFLFAAVLLVYVLTQRKQIARTLGSGRRQRGLTGFVLFMALLTFTLIYMKYLRPEYNRPVEEDDRLFPEDPVTNPRGEGDQVGTPYEPEFAWIPVLVVLALLAIGVAAYVLAARRANGLPERSETEAVDELADALDDTLDDLRAEPDPRRAVIAAYARVERALAAAGHPRREPETPAEYIHRILGRLEVDPVSVRTLEQLFTRAKFSQHDVDAAMKDEAIRALERIRDDLREVARRHEEARQRAVSARERAAAL